MQFTCTRPKCIWSANFALEPGVCILFCLCKESAFAPWPVMKLLCLMSGRTTKALTYCMSHKRMCNVSWLGLLFASWKQLINYNLDTAMNTDILFDQIQRVSMWLSCCYNGERRVSHNYTRQWNNLEVSTKPPWKTLLPLIRKFCNC